MADFDASNSTCTCQPSCEETDYEITMSNSMWPSTQYKTAAIKAYIAQPSKSDSSASVQSSQTTPTQSMQSATMETVTSQSVSAASSSTLAVDSTLIDTISSSVDSAVTTTGQIIIETTANSDPQSKTVQSTSIPQPSSSAQTATTTTGTTSASTLASTASNIVDLVSDSSTDLITGVANVGSTTAPTSITTSSVPATFPSLSTQVTSVPTLSPQTTTKQGGNFNFVRRKRQLAQSGTQPDISENLINLNIYMATLDTKLVGEYAIYSVGDGSMFAALGGVFSLYLGISVLGLFEFLGIIFIKKRNSLQLCQGGYALTVSKTAS